MHAVSIQEVTSLADSYDLPLICADLQVSIKQSMGCLKHVEHLYNSHLGDREVTAGGRKGVKYGTYFFGGGVVQYFIFCKSAYHKQ